jgi:hypothetical protein
MAVFNHRHYWKMTALETGPLRSKDTDHPFDQQRHWARGEKTCNNDKERTWGWGGEQ